MPSLTPLRFRRRLVFPENATDFDEPSTKPFYGHSEYTTHCRRFNIHKEQKYGWYITGCTTNDMTFLCEVGLWEEFFATRAAALGALTIVCEDAGLI